MDKLELIRNHLSENHKISPESITPASRLDEIGVDSLSFLELVFVFESKFGISAPDKEIYSMKTIGELIALVDKLIDEKQ